MYGKDGVQDGKMSSKTFWLFVETDMTEVYKVRKGTEVKCMIQDARLYMHTGQASLCIHGIQDFTHV